MGFFTGLKEASAAKSNRFHPGRYPAVRVEACKVFQGTAAQGGVRFIVEATVVSEPISSGEVGKENRPVTPDPIGVKRSWSTQLDGQFPHYARQEIKSFLMAVYNKTEDEINAMDPDMLAEQACSPANPLKGRLVATEAFTHVTKNNRPMVKHIWSPVEASTTVHNVPTPPDEPEAATAPAAPPPGPARLDPMDRARAEGWQPHPSSPGAWYKGTESVWEIDLKARYR